MLDPDMLLSWPFVDIDQSYDEAFSMSYALAIGIGDNPLDAGQLSYVAEGGCSDLRAFPTIAVVLGYPGAWMADPRTGLDYGKIVHGEEYVVFHDTILPKGRVISRHKVSSIVDKGDGKGAIIVYDKDIYDSDTMRKLATVTHTTFARGDGGFSQTPVAPSKQRPSPAELPQFERSWITRTLPQQALLYRLCADRNPLHSDPGTALRAGFERPILHGLCTYGIAAHGIVAQWCDYDAAQLETFGCRFASPVIPGDTLVVRSTRLNTTINFDVWNMTRERVALSAGRACLRS